MNSIIPDETIHTDTLPPKVSEQRLWEICQDLPGQNILAMSVGRGQAAQQLALQRPDAQVGLWYLDLFPMSLAIESLSASSQPLADTPHLTVQCLDDWPEVPCDLALLPLLSTNEAELSRDLLQSAYQRLEVGGLLVASVDHPKDRWLHDQMKVYNKSVKVRAFDDAVVYFVKKEQPLKRVRDFSAQFSFRDLDHVLQVVTRPGVFSHRELDNGARQLLDAVDVYPEASILDIGCGSGAVAMGLAAREPSASIHAVDSHARAVDCTRRGIELNGLSNVTVELNHSGEYGLPGRFDMALANPPYYADFRIAELFIKAAVRSLRPGGRLVMVTKSPRWYEENLAQWLIDHEVFPSKRYHIASGLKPQA